MALEVCRLAHLDLDPWQEFTLTSSLGERADGKWSAYEVAEVVSRQNGKGPHALDTPILTTDGWTTFASIRSGQHVYGADGRPTRVIAVSDVFPHERCYKVGFTDGAEYVVGAGHLWHVKRKDSGGWRAVATETLARSVGGRRQDNGRVEYNWRVRCDAVPQTPSADLPLDPYVFGLWLGDGNSIGAVITVGEQDLAFAREQLLAAGYTITREYQGNDEWRPWHLAFALGQPWSRDGFLPRLRKLGVYGNKHIPDIYLTASPAQRLELLRGLMDTDGSVASTNRSPQVEFSSSCEPLARDFQRLARSLGIRVSAKCRTTTHKDNWRFLWTPTVNPFRMPRKAQHFQAPVSRRHEVMSVTSVEPVPTVPTRCIQVANADGVYLVGQHFTPTHNSILEGRELTGLFAIDEERLIIHSAHEQATSSEHFRRLLMLIESVPDFDRQVMKAPRGKGAEAIELRNGSRIFFKTRTGSGGRGLTGDLVVLDEAMILPAATMGVLVPTMAARTVWGNPQLWYAGSAVDQRVHEHGVVLALVRMRGLKRAPSLMYVEWSAEGDDPDAVPAEALADPQMWAQANPGLGIRISAEHVANELGGALGLREFAVERLGIGDWPDPDQVGDAVIDLDVWDGLVDRQSAIDGPVCLAFDVTPDRQRAAISVAGHRPDGLAHVEVVEHRKGTGWVADDLVQLTQGHDVSSVVYVEGSPAASLASQIPDAVALSAAPAKKYAEACGGLFDIVDQTALRHLGTDDLRAALKGAKKTEFTSGAWAWSRKSSTVDISPLVACTLALSALNARPDRDSSFADLSPDDFQISSLG